MAPDDPEAVISKMAADETYIVSLTITEEDITTIHLAVNLVY